MSYLTVSEMSTILKIPVRTIQYLIQKGEGPEAIRVGRTIRVSEIAFEKWISELANETKEESWIL